MLLSDGLFFGGVIYVLCMNWKKINKDLPTCTTQKFTSYKFLKKTSLKGRVPGSLDAVCLANKDSRIRRSIRTFISNRVECQFILVELYPFTQVWLLHFTEMYVVVFVIIGIFPIKGEHEKNKLETTTYKTISSRQGSFSNPAKALILAFGNFPPQWIDSSIPFTQKVSSCKV